jgi:1,4-dihydroxy-2-naphthoate octaprenyltransferase
MINKIFSILKPINTLFILLTYFLGIGIAHYLGFPQKLNPLWNGLILIVAFHTGSVFLGKYLNDFIFCYPQYYAKDKVHSNEFQEQKIFQTLVLLIGVACIAICMIPIFAFIVSGGFKITNLIIIVMAIFIICVIEMFPAQVSSAGLLEFLQAMVFANLIPSIAFSLQANTFHRLLFLLTFPLLFLFLALFIILGVPRVKNNLESKDQSIFSKIGPILTLKIHNLLILLAYLTLLLGSIFDLPWKLIWPTLVTLPIGMIQLWQINQILKGHKPAIHPLIFNAIGTTGLATYFMILSLFLN